MISRRRITSLLVVLAVLGLVVVGVATTMVALNPDLFFGERPAPRTFQASDTWVDIAITPADVERLPADFVAVVRAEQPPLALEDAITASIDALLLHRQTLVDIAADAAQRAHLNAVLDAGKMVVVYDMGSANIREALDGPIAASEPRTPGRVASSLHATDRGILPGQLFVSSDRPPIKIESIYGYIRLNLEDPLTRPE